MRSSSRAWLRGWLAAGLLLAANAAWAADTDVGMTLHADHPGPLIHREIFGQFSEHLGEGIYGGIWVGPHSPMPNTDGYRTDVLDALRKLKVPVLRWPGGCFADQYHWRDGIGPRSERPTRVNANWGGLERNAFGTQEFMDFAELIGARAYIAADVGSAPPQEMADWIEYMTSPSQSSLAQLRRRNGRDRPWKVAYLGVGNELWGCGGNMRAQYAADVYRRYQTFVHAPPGQHIQRIAPGPNGDDYHWTRVMMREDARYMDGLSLHYYTLPGSWQHKESATRFGEKGWIETLSRALYMDTLIRRHSAIMDTYDPHKHVALVVDEWGTWYKPESGPHASALRQQNTLRDALVASLTLNIFMHHADRVRMADIAQMVNVLQAMILTRGRQMLLTPTYHVFHMYRPFQGATALPLDVDTPQYRDAGYSVPAVQAAAARGRDGHVYIALANLDPRHAARIDVRLDGMDARMVSGQVLTAPAMNARNTFSDPGAVHPVAFHGAQVTAHRLRAQLPPKSVTVLQLR